MTSPVRDALLQAGLLSRLEGLKREVDGMLEAVEGVRSTCNTLIDAIENRIAGASRRLRLLREYVEGKAEEPPLPPSPPP